MTALAVEIPQAFEPLLLPNGGLRPSRYKALHGGRGGAKSHFFAEQIILKCYTAKTRVACIREVQATIKDSVRQLLIDKIQKFGLGKFFEVLESEIRAPNGSLIIFKGMQTYNAENIKSLEDFDIAWVEEAQTFSAHSLKLLRPTIRKEGSEIWFSWNPRHETDAVDAFFRSGSAPANAIVCEVNWRDNPWFTGVLQDEMQHDFANDPEMAEHVWNGGYELISEASYYAKLIVAAEKDGRVGHFPYDPALPVKTSWDIGVDDYTAVWFFQEDGTFATVIDYWEASGDGAEQTVRAALPELNPDEREVAAALLELDRDEPFTYGRHFLPHDVKNREWGSGGKTRLLTLRELGVKPIHIGAPVGPVERINATRRLLPFTRFHDTKRVRLGLQRLRRYSRKFNEAMQTYTTPLHDENSHGADAFGEFAVNCRIAPKPEPKPDPKPQELEFLAGPGGVVQGNMSVRDAVEAMVRRRRGL